MGMVWRFGTSRRGRGQWATGPGVSAVVSGGPAAPVPADLSRDGRQSWWYRLGASAQGAGGKLGGQRGLVASGGEPFS